MNGIIPSMHNTEDIVAEDETHLVRLKQGQKISPGTLAGQQVLMFNRQLDPMF